MPVFSIQTPSGKILDIEADDESKALDGAKQWHMTAPVSQPSPIAEDVARSVIAAPRKVAEGLAGLPGTMQHGVNAGIDYLTGETAPPNAQRLATPADIQKQTSKLLGPSYQPQTVPGQFAGAATEGATGALLGPGGAIAKLGVGIGSGLGSEAAGQQFSGTPYETPARLAGGLAGGLVSPAVLKTGELAANRISAQSAGNKIGDILGTGPVKAGAVNRVAKSAKEDELTAQGAKDTQAQLGPETMLMDLGRQLQGRAEQMALHAGKSQNTVLDAVEGRTGQYGSGASDRIKQTLDQHLGPSQNVVQLLDKVDNLVQQHAAPAYRNVMERYPVVNVPPEITERPAVASAMKNANTLAKNYGEKLTANEGDTIQPSLRYWDYVKKGLDQRINGMMRSGMDDLPSAEKADLGGLLSAKKSLVDYLDGITGGEYQRARAIAATKPELHEAMDFGRSIFSSKLLPEEVQAHIRDLSLPAQTMAQVGARRELERTLDSVRNDGAKARAFLDTNNNRQKISDLFGPQAAKAIEDRVAAENTFQSATDTIARNSRTAVRQELAKDTAGFQPGDYHNTVAGALGAGVKAGFTYPFKQGMEATRGDISNLLTVSGNKLPPVVEQLLKHNARTESQAVTPMGTQFKALMRALAAGQLGQ